MSLRKFPRWTTAPTEEDWKDLWWWLNRVSIAAIVVSTIALTMEYFGK